MAQQISIRKSTITPVSIYWTSRDVERNHILPVPRATECLVTNAASGRRRDSHEQQPHPIQVLSMRPEGAHHGLSGQCLQLISSRPTAGNASPANDGAFTISFHVPTMPLQLQDAECRRSTYAWAAHGMERIDGYEPTIEFVPVVNPIANTVSKDTPSICHCREHGPWQEFPAECSFTLRSETAEDGKSLTPV
jgi:hypothetical protein